MRINPRVLSLLVPVFASILLYQAHFIATQSFAGETPLTAPITGPVVNPTASPTPTITKTPNFRLIPKIGDPRMP